MFRGQDLKNREISVKEFGIGSILMINGDRNSDAFLFTTNEKKENLIVVNLGTFQIYELQTKVYDVYFLTAGEASKVFDEIRTKFGHCATFSDGGWLSSGLKKLKLEYRDD